MRSWPRAPPPTIFAFNSGHSANPYHVPGMEHHEALSCRGKVEERLPIGRSVEELTVDADHGYIGIADFGCSLVAILGVVHAETSGAERRAIGCAEELSEVMLLATGNDEDLRLAGRPHDRLRLGQRRIPATTFLRTRRLP